MTVKLKHHRLSIQDYHRMMEVGILTAHDRVELINGEIIEMSPIGSPHAACVDFLAEELIIALQRKARVRVQNPIALLDYSEPEPDIVVVKPGRYQSRHPRAEEILLIIEVADTSLVYDRDIKGPLYAQAGIAEYWLVNLIDRQVEVYRRPEGGKYTQRFVLRGEDELVLEEFGMGFVVEDVVGENES